MAASQTWWNFIHVFGLTMSSNTLLKKWTWFEADISGLVSPVQKCKYEFNRLVLSQLITRGKSDLSLWTILLMLPLALCDLLFGVFFISLPWVRLQKGSRCIKGLMKMITCVFKFTWNSPLFSTIMEDPAVFKPLNYLGSQWDLEGMCMCKDV